MLHTTIDFLVSNGCTHTYIQVLHMHMPASRCNLVSGYIHTIVVEVVCLSISSFVLIAKKKDFSSLFFSSLELHVLCGNLLTHKLLYFWAVLNGPTYLPGLIVELQALSFSSQMPWLRKWLERRRSENAHTHIGGVELNCLHTGKIKDMVAWKSLFKVKALCQIPCFLKRQYFVFKDMLIFLNSDSD